MEKEPTHESGAFDWQQDFRCVSKPHKLISLPFFSSKNLTYELEALYDDDDAKKHGFKMVRRSYLNTKTNSFSIVSH